MKQWSRTQQRKIRHRHRPVQDARLVLVLEELQPPHGRVRHRRVLCVSRHIVVAQMLPIDDRSDLVKLDARIVTVNEALRILHGENTRTHANDRIGFLPDVIGQKIGLHAGALVERQIEQRELCGEDAEQQRANGGEQHGKDAWEGWYTEQYTY